MLHLHMQLIHNLISSATLVMVCLTVSPPPQLSDPRPRVRRTGLRRAEEYVSDRILINLSRSDTNISESDCFVFSVWQR
ncbi:hypothetical protein N7510_004309 [Penicillium lagena]|uniref:uncharacterized protein n=1 Tax=Penicillium lagena TaxID=94218 RepID=UPI00254175E2|nr:uncharacterized protein N7510_004309 [Penicillium lagena]KAJ5620325.1 hypothetical protein N7510_004309 [Penicillium lagena]